MMNVTPDASPEPDVFEPVLGANSDSCAPTELQNGVYDGWLTSKTVMVNKPKTVGAVLEMFSLVQLQMPPEPDFKNQNQTILSLRMA